MNVNLPLRTIKKLLSTVHREMTCRLFCQWSLTEQHYAVFFMIANLHLNDIVREETAKHECNQIHKSTLSNYTRMRFSVTGNLFRFVIFAAQKLIVFECLSNLDMSLLKMSLIAEKTFIEWIKWWWWWWW